MAALLPAPRGTRSAFAGHRHRHGTAIPCCLCIRIADWRRKRPGSYIQKLSAFAEYLEAAGITELGRITPQHIREFYENAKNDGPRRSYGSTLDRKSTRLNSSH